MPKNLSAFEDACREHARLLRRLPKDLRRELANEVRDDVAEPLAAEIRAAWGGPYGPRLSAATKARVSADPQVVVGGARRVFSHGASVNDVVHGAEFGGGTGRVSAVPGYSRRGHRVRGYARRGTTKQFKAQHAMYGTISAGYERMLSRWADAVDKVLGRLIDGG